MTFFFIPFAVLPHSLVSFRYEYTLLLNPMNSLIGIPDTSSLNFPITFCLIYRNTESFLDIHYYPIYPYHSKSLYLYTSSVSIFIYVNESVYVNNSLALPLYFFS